MAGDKHHNSKLLNNTLVFIIKLLNENNIKNWFISYGTLLGIVRSNSCIEGDDDIDIVIEDTYYDKLKEILTKNKLTLTYKYGIDNSKSIIKIDNTNDYCSIDFYMASIDKEGNFHDKWNNILWSKCYCTDGKLIERVWNGQKLYLPFNSEQKLINRYGKDWMTPKNNFKGLIPFRTYAVL
jgi:hypothetical protein